MARARNIKPKFFQNDELGELPPLARLLFIGLWTIADFNGCLEYRPKRIKAQLLPYDECSIEDLVKSLEKSGFISIYSVAGQLYIKILKFKEHQNPHKNEKDAGAACPDISENDNEINELKEDGNNRDKDGSTRAESLFPLPDSPFLNPDPGYRQPRETAPAEKANGAETARAVTAVDLSIAMRAAGMQTQPADPRLIALAAQGVDPETVTAACEEAARAKPGQRIGAGYIFAILERWAADAAAMQVAGATAPKAASAWWASLDAMRAKAADLGIPGPRPGENEFAFKGRIQSAIERPVGGPPASDSAPAPAAASPPAPRSVKPAGLDLKALVGPAPTPKEVA